MSNVRVTLSPELIGLADRIYKAITIAHRESADAGINEVRKQIAVTDTVATHRFLNSTIKQFDEQGAARIWQVGSALYYAEWANRGRRRGGRPPIGAILQWIRARGISPNTPGMTDRQLAFLIARRIGQRGWKGKYPYTRAYVLLPTAVEKVFADALAPLQKDYQ